MRLTLEAEAKQEALAQRLLAEWEIGVARPN